MTKGNPKTTNEISPEIEIEEDEEGVYFRATGMVYLHIEHGSAAHESWISQTSPLKSRDHLDPIALQLLNYRSRLEYEKPAIAPYLIELIGIVEDMHAALLASNYAVGLGHAEKQSVIVSGSELEFLTGEKFKMGETVTVHMTFTEYPFVSLVILAKVTGIQPFAGDRKKHRICLAFDGIREADRDNIIRYVNHLQRRRSPRNQDNEPKK
jgi:hypothetical protein